MTVRVFVMDDCEWYAAETLDQAKARYREDSGFPLAEMEESRELTDTEMNSLHVRRDDGTSCTFAEALDEMIADGQIFPCEFASTEY